MTCTLVLGGARSGKSAYAEQLATAAAKQVIYLATAQAGDAEMAARIERHRTQRPTHWATVEEPLQLGTTIQQWCTPQHLILVDCLTVWLSNLLFSEAQNFPDVGIIDPPQRFHDEREHLLQALHKAQKHAQAEVILVSNEVGMGIIPHGALSRWFADEAGRLNQAVAALCDRVVLVAAGLPLVLKG